MGRHRTGAHYPRTLGYFAAYGSNLDPGGGGGHVPRGGRTHGGPLETRVGCGGRLRGWRFDLPVGPRSAGRGEKNGRPRPGVPYGGVSSTAESPGSRSELDRSGRGGATEGRPISLEGRVFETPRLLWSVLRGSRLPTRAGGWFAGALRASRRYLGAVDPFGPRATARTTGSPAEYVARLRRALGIAIQSDERAIQSSARF